MRIDTSSVAWTRKQGFVVDHLTNLGYPMALMWASGLSAEGYREIVLDENGKRQIDPGSNLILTKFAPWIDPTHWDWMLANAPLEYEDGEGSEEPV